MHSLACGLIQQSFMYSPAAAIELFWSMVNWGERNIGPEDTLDIIYTWLIHMYATKPGRNGTFERITPMSEVFWLWFKSCTHGREWV
jgi:hypothetical protein